MDLRSPSRALSSEPHSWPYKDDLVFWTGRVIRRVRRAGAWAQKHQHRRENAHSTAEAFVFPSRSTRLSAHTPQERQTSTNASYAKKGHLPGLFADQMEYLRIHELCEVLPRLSKETTLKELGLS